MDGYAVMTHSDAARWGQLFVTATGNLNVFRRERFEAMSDGVALVGWRCRTCWSSWAMTPASSSGLPVPGAVAVKITTLPPGSAWALTTGRRTT